jgi:DNA-binding response OmpR family regulator
VRLSVADPGLRARVADALGATVSGPVIVTTDLQGLPALRAAEPRARLVIVAVARAEVAAALDAGADVALAGELRPAELAARVRALTRRAQSRESVGPLALDVRARSAALDGRRLELPRREFTLLCALASDPGRVFTKAELLASCWGTCSPGSRTLERHVARLRRRLDRHAAMLVTVWGVGYRLDAVA